jgi:hypothetical protein
MSDMVADLFAAGGLQPKPVAPKRLRLSPPCCACGARVAPFGEGVSLRRYMTAGDERALGRWFCGPCWRRKGVA